MPLSEDEINAWFHEIENQEFEWNNRRIRAVNFTWDYSNSRCQFDIICMPCGDNICTWPLLPNWLDVAENMGFTDLTIGNVNATQINGILCRMQVVWTG